MEATMPYEMSQLLPFAPDTLLNSLHKKIRTLQFMSFLYGMAQEAIHAFLKQQYDQFDAQVSENLCQIRACQLINFIKQNRAQELTCCLAHMNEMSERSHALIVQYSDFLTKRPSHYAPEIDQVFDLASFLRLNQLHLSLSDLTYFLIQSFILSKYKYIEAYDISHGINYDAFCQDVGIESKTFIRKFVHRLQRNLSKLSCQFMMKLAAEVSNMPQEKFLLQALYYNDEVGRHLIASYEVTKLILQYIYQHHYFIKVIVSRMANHVTDELTFFLKGATSSSHYTLCLPQDVPLEEIIVFRGICRQDNNFLEPQQQYINKFMQIGFDTVMLSNLAQHPQYAGLLLDDKKYNP